MSQTISLDEAQLLSKVVLFRGLDRVALAQLAARFDKVHVPAGQAVVVQGEPGDALFVVASGLLKVTVASDGGPEAVVNQQGPGEYFGEMALLTDAPRSATVRAHEDAVVLRLGRKAFMALLEQQPAVASSIIGTISERLRRSDSALVASQAALEGMLGRFLDQLPPDRRARLLQASLLEDAAEPLLAAIFGADGQPAWQDLLDACAAQDQPARRVVALLRARCLAETVPADLAGFARAAAARLASTGAWPEALTLASAYASRPDLLALLSRAANQVPLPPPSERLGEDAPPPEAGAPPPGSPRPTPDQPAALTLATLRPWLEDLTQEEAAGAAELARACAQLYRERGDEAAAAALLGRAGGGALLSGEGYAALVANAVQTAGQPAVPGQGLLARLWPRGAGRPLLLLAIAFGLFAFAAIGAPGQPAFQFLLLLCAAIVLWVGQVAADSFVALALLMSWLLLGVAKPAQALAGYGSTNWLFVVSVLALAVAVARSGLLFRVGLLLIRRMPRSLIGQCLTLAGSGILLTPLLPMAQGRVSLVFPLTSALAEALDLRDREPRAAVLGLSAWLGTTPMTFLFLNGAPFTLLAWGLLPEAERLRFNWLYWVVAALPLGLVIVLVYLGLLFALFRPTRAGAPPRAKLDLELAVLGKATGRETAMLVVLLLTIAGWMLAGELGLDVGVIAVLGVLGAVATGNLSAKNLKELDWNFLLFYGGALSVGGTAVRLGLDKTAGAVLAAALGFAQGSPLLFILIVAVVGIGVQMIISKSQAVLLLSLVLLPVAPSFGVNPWIAAIVILATSSMWYYRAQTSSYALAWSIAEGRLYSENQGRVACLAFTAALFVGLLAAVPYWHFLGLL